MSERPVYRSLVNRLAVEVPLLAKALVDDALARHHLSPATVSPFELKRLIDSDILPRMTRILQSSRSPHVSTLGGGIVQIAPDGGVVQISPSARRLLQLSPRLAGTALLHRLEELGAIRHPEQLVGDGRQLESWRIELNRTVLQCSAALIRCVEGEPGTVAGVVVTIFDVTLEKELEEAMIDMAERAEAASNAKSRFLATMSHEIRTPLNAIVGMTSLLLDTHLDDQQKEFAETSVQGARVLLSLINDILDLSRLESGRLDLERMPFDIRVPVGEAASIIDCRVQEAGVEFDWRVDEEVPERVEGDPARLRQILLNLLDNAIKFTKGGRVDLSVERVPADEDVVRLRLRVTDTGVGIPPDRVEHIFDAFTQADTSTTRQYGGSGLGLAICRRLVEHMGGGIDVRSVLGEGSTFTVEIPFGRVRGDAPRVSPTAQEDEDVGAELPSDRTGHILVAEDNAVNRLVITRILERMGYDVRVVENGQEAVDALSDPFDLVLMDCQMPVMDGFDATRAIRRGDGDVLDPNVPIVALTASALEEGRERCRAAGMNAFVTKPVAPLKLERVLRRWLAKTENRG